MPGFAAERLEIGRRGRIGGADLQYAAGCHVAQRLARAQDRKRTSEAGRVENGFGHLPLREQVAGAPGFEPGITGSKPVALPLGYTPPENGKDKTPGRVRQRREKADIRAATQVGSARRFRYGQEPSALNDAGQGLLLHPVFRGSRRPRRRRPLASAVVPGGSYRVSGKFHVAAGSLPRRRGPPASQYP